VRKWLDEKEGDVEGKNTRGLIMGRKMQLNEKVERGDLRELRTRRDDERNKVDMEDSKLDDYTSEEIAARQERLSRLYSYSPADGRGLPSSPTNYSRSTHASATGEKRREKKRKLGL
jgi:hypothetical protein